MPSSYATLRHKHKVDGKSSSACHNASCLTFASIVFELDASSRSKLAVADSKSNTNYINCNPCGYSSSINIRLRIPFTYSKGKCQTLCLLSNINCIMQFFLISTLYLNSS